MTTRNTLGLATAMVSVAALLSGCGGSSVQPAPVATPPATQSAQSITPWDHGVFYEKLPDGYGLMCVYARNGYDGGLSCDWPGHQAWVEAKAASK